MKYYDIGLYFFLLFVLILIGWFITSLVLFIRTPKNTSQRQLYEGMLIASSIVTFVYTASAALILYILMNPISFM